MTNQHNPAPALLVAICVVAACITIWNLRPETPLPEVPEVDLHAARVEEAANGGWVKTFCPPSFQSLGGHDVRMLWCEERR